MSQNLFHINAKNSLLWYLVRGNVPGYGAVWNFRRVPTFRRNVLPPSLTLNTIIQTYNVCSFNKETLFHTPAKQSSVTGFVFRDMNKSHFRNTPTGRLF
jgi:hypothetical protein